MKQLSGFELLLSHLKIFYPMFKKFLCLKLTLILCLIFEFYCLGFIRHLLSLIQDLGSILSLLEENSLLFFNVRLYWSSSSQLKMIATISRSSQ